MKIIELEVESYLVMMVLVGIIEFDEVFKSVFIVFVYYVDMVVVFGYGDVFNVMYSLFNFEGNYDKFFEWFNGVLVDWLNFYNLWNLDKEILYEFDSDFYLVDLVYVLIMDVWDIVDVEEV